MGDVYILFVFKSLLTTPSNVLPLNLKQTLPPIIWIFTAGEGDGIESRQPFKIFFYFTGFAHGKIYLSHEPLLFLKSLQNIQRDPAFCLTLSKPSEIKAEYEKEQM